MLRREFLIAAASGFATSLARGARTTRQVQTLRPKDELAAIERRVGGRLGVTFLDTATGRRLEYRAEQRFPMCSTFKWLLVAQVLSRVEKSKENLSRMVHYDASDLLEYAPITREHVNEGMSVSALCEAAIEYSDNTAANLLLKTVGGPAGLTSYLRGIGDHVTRLDRMEPELNSAVRGDPRDTTTPNAMMADMHTLLLGTRLAAASRDLLLHWLESNTTGGAKLRAGLPREWRIGDKTGMGAHGSTNDVAIVWSAAGRAPILVAAYLTETTAEVAERNAALTSVGGLLAHWLRM